MALDTFPTDTPKTYPSGEMNELFAAILLVDTKEEAAVFFRDLMTMAELTELAHRWQIVKLLVQGKSYMEIADTLKTSTTTVTRVAHWLNNGMGGYKRIAERLWKDIQPKTRVRQFKLRSKRTFV